MWLEVGVGAGTIIGLAYLALPERLKELCSTLLALCGWGFILSLFGLMWGTGNPRVWVAEPNIGIRIFETVAISFFIILYIERLIRDIQALIKKGEK